MRQVAEKNRGILTINAKAVVFTLGVVAMFTGPVLGSIAFRHTGNNDPLLDDFPTLSTVGDPSGYSVGPADGENSWHVVGLGGQALYESDELTSADPKDGWKATARVKIEGIEDDLEDGGVFFQFADGEHAFRMLFGSNPSGDILVGIPVNVSSGGLVIFPQTTFSTDGPGEHGYHLFEWVWTPNVIQHGGGSANLFIDGQLVVSDFVGIDIPGEAAPPPVVKWGTVGGTGSALFNFIQLETGTVFEELDLPGVFIPEPTSIAFLGAGGLLLLRGRRSGRVG